MLKFNPKKNKEILKKTNIPINSTKLYKKNQQHNAKISVKVLRKEELTEPYTFIKWKDRKTVNKFLRKGPLTVKKKKLEELLKKLSALKNVNFIFKSLDINVKFPIKKRPGEKLKFIKEGEKLEIPIKSLNKDLVLSFRIQRKIRRRWYQELKGVVLSWKFLKSLIKFQDRNLVFPISSLEKNLELLKEGEILEVPIKRITKIYRFKYLQNLELIIERKDRNLVFLLNRRYKPSIFAVKRETEDQIQEFLFYNKTNSLLPISSLERNIKILINSLEEDSKCRIVNMFRSIVLHRLQNSAFFSYLWKEENELKRNKFKLSFLLWWYYEKYLETNQFSNLIWNLILSIFDITKKFNLYLESKQRFFKNIFLEDFLIFDNSYLLSLKNQWLNKKKINDYQFFKFCYFLKIHIFSSILKGKILLSNVFLKLKPFLKISPLFFKANKVLKPVKKEKKFKSKNIIFQYRYNYSLSKSCNALRFLFYKKRWEEKIKTEKKPSFIIKNYGLMD